MPDTSRAALWTSGAALFLAACCALPVLLAAAGAGTALAAAAGAPARLAFPALALGAGLALLGLGLAVRHGTLRRQAPQFALATLMLAAALIVLLSEAKIIAALETWT